MSPTYELTQESKLVELPGNGRTIQVFRIRALKDLPGAGVRAGDLGGFVESYQNLQHDDSGDSAWIYNNAAAAVDAVVKGNACVRDDAVVLSATILQDADIRDSSDYVVLELAPHLGTFTCYRTKQVPLVAYDSDKPAVPLDTLTGHFYSGNITCQSTPVNPVDIGIVSAFSALCTARAQYWD